MLEKGGRFLFGLFTGLLAAGVLTLLLAEPRGIPIQLLPPPTPAPVRVHVAGAVGAPGVYLLAPGAIVGDAVAAAGGARLDADLDALNLAAGIEDGERIFVPGLGTPLPQEPAASSAAGGTINVNTASAAELETLPGIGPTLAGEIVRFRDQNGPFQSVEDLIRVPGIGPSRMSQLRELVRVE